MEKNDVEIHDGIHTALESRRGEGISYRDRQTSIFAEISRVDVHSVFASTGVLRKYEPRITPARTVEIRYERYIMVSLSSSWSQTSDGAEKNVKHDHDGHVRYEIREGGREPHVSGFPIFHRFIGDHRCVLTALLAANNVPDVSRGISVPLILVLLTTLRLVLSFCPYMTRCDIDRFRQHVRLFRMRVRCRTVRGSGHPGVRFREILNLAFSGSFRRVPGQVRICVPCNHQPTRYSQRFSTCNSTVSYAVDAS